jgi:hypothetical protein
MRAIPIVRTAVCIFLAIVGGPVLSSANDSSAELSVGGLVFKHDTNVSIESEELTITANTITVRYRFLNRSQKPVALMVAFPLPNIDLTDSDNIAIPTSDSANFIGFHTKIDGRPVAFTVVQRAFLGGKDVSQTIRRAGLPLLPLGDLRAQIGALPKKVREQMIADGLIISAGSNERGQPLYSAGWIVKTSVLRHQVFPPGRTVFVEHRYHTSVGVSYDTVLRKALRQSKGMEKEFQRYRADYCISDGLLIAIDNMAGSDEANTAKLMEQRINYVLKTGANWAGPIKDFRLVVDKGRKNNLVSFCAPNIRKISPTDFEVHLKNFTPKRNLKVLIIGKSQ